jgi:hypothetical protein
VLHVGLDLSRGRVDVCLISSEGELVEHFRSPADRDGLYGLSRRVAVYDEPVRGVVEWMNGARFVHDELVRYGWEVLVADARVRCRYRGTRRRTRAARLRPARGEPEQKRGPRSSLRSALYRAGKSAAIQLKS